MYNGPPPTDPDSLCDLCHGKGKLFRRIPKFILPVHVTCWRCDGTGKNLSYVEAKRPISPPPPPSRSQQQKRKYCEDVSFSDGDLLYGSTIAMSAMTITNSIES